ncbi:hypothetical protein ITI46_16780 [Streptomyces oryzae]|uniref:Uncharacterized protein n=1 Tax=Streptomyces oryzae TaxID=1434886 RepID=A0ABS3XD46_9ACTN|nr:hypothetical protein [Streptomyces oryzae]MBO8193307.1 hypothetical protein [Streptomyces oryzae]
MGFSMEIVAARADELADAVPDVFAETDTTLGFEDATSVSRGSELCVTKSGDWVIVIDVWHRLSGFTPYLVEASASTDLYLVRIGGDPAVFHYRDGCLQMAAEGSHACMELAAVDYDDGEVLGQELLLKYTGVSFADDDLWSAEFTVFALD